MTAAVRYEREGRQDSVARGLVSPSSEAGSPIVVRWLEPAAVSEAEVARWLEALDAHERVAAGRFRFVADQRQYIVAHALARGLLGAVTTSPAASLAFRRQPGGKPELAQAGAPRRPATKVGFSLSHTRTLVAVAVGRGWTLGIDVEPSGRRAAATEIAERHFAPAEAQLVNRQGLATFLRLWTLKEAYVKATGEGLARPLCSFAFQLDPLRVDDGAPERGWRFAELRPDAGHYLALAALPSAGRDARFALDARAMAPAELSALLQ